MNGWSRSQALYGVILYQVMMQIAQELTGYLGGADMLRRRAKKPEEMANNAIFEGPGQGGRPGLP